MQSSSSRFRAECSSVARYRLPWSRTTATETTKPEILQKYNERKKRNRKREENKIKNNNRHEQEEGKHEKQQCVSIANQSANYHENNHHSQTRHPSTCVEKTKPTQLTVEVSRLEAWPRGLVPLLDISDDIIVQLFQLKRRCILQSWHSTRKHLVRIGPNSRFAVCVKPCPVRAVRKLLDADRHLPVDALNSKCPEFGDVGNFPHSPLLLSEESFEVALVAQPPAVHRKLSVGFLEEFAVLGSGEHVPSSRSNCKPANFSGGFHVR